MTEKLQYDPAVAQSAVEHRTKSNEAMDEHAKAVHEHNMVARLGAIARLGVVGRFAARKEVRGLKQQLPVITEFDAVTGASRRVPGATTDQFVAVREVWKTQAAAKADIQGNFSGNYDNAVIEADNAFINKGRSTRIRTPDVMQQQADQAKSWIEQQQPLDSTQSPEAPSPQR